MLDRVRTGAARSLVRTTLKPLLAPRVPVPVQRAGLELAVAGFPGVAARTSAVNLGGVPGLRVTPPGDEPRTTIVYLHGGGYVIGSAGSYRKLAARIARSAAAEVLVLDYRRAPEHRFPAARDDVLSAWRALCSRPGEQRLVLAGDSAGGGLALASTIALREAGLPLPRALVLISPWLDLRLTGETITAKRAADPVLSPEAIERWGSMYAGDTDPADPGLSPLFGDLTGLPPTLVQVGTEEILLADAERLAAADGGSVTLERYEGLWHDFQLFAGIVPAAGRAIGAIGAFVRSAAG